MDDLKILTPQIIGENTNVDKGTELAEDISIPTIEVPTIEYGQSQNTLDAQLALRNLITNTFVAGAGISITNIGGVITITNTGVITEPLDLFLLAGA